MVLWAGLAACFRMLVGRGWRNGTIIAIVELSGRRIKGLRLALARRSLIMAMALW
jgi:hypothetical protein